MTSIKLNFLDYKPNNIKNWSISHIGYFKYTIGDVLYHDIGDGWQLYIKMPITDKKAYWIVEIDNDEKAIEFKLRFL